MKSKNQKLVIACVAAALCGTAGLRADDQKTEKSSTEQQGAYQEPAGAEKSEARSADEKFAEEAVKGGLAEVKMGELAQQKAQSASVKQFGQKLAKDHKEANQKLKDICDRKHAKKNISEAEKQAKIKEMEAENQKMIDHLSSLSGEEFDKTFIEHAVNNHKKGIKKYQKEASEGEDPAYRSFASETLPTLREHLKIAQSLQDNPNASLPELREPAGAESKSDSQNSDSQQQDQPQQDQQQQDQQKQSDDSQSQPDAKP